MTMQFLKTSVFVLFISQSLLNGMSRDKKPIKLKHYPNVFSITDLIIADRSAYGFTPQKDGSYTISYSTALLEDLAKEYKESGLDPLSYIEKKERQTPPVSRLSLSHSLAVQLEANLINSSYKSRFKKNLGFLDGMANHCGNPRLNRAIYRWLDICKLDGDFRSPPAALLIAFHQRRGFEEGILNNLSAKVDGEGLISFANECWLKYDKELTIKSLNKFLNLYDDPENFIDLSPQSINTLTTLLVALEKDDYYEASSIAFNLYARHFNNTKDPLEKITFWVDLLDHKSPTPSVNPGSLEPSAHTLIQLSQPEFLNNLVDIYKTCNNSRWVILMSPFLWKILLLASDKKTNQTNTKLISQSANKLIHSIGERFFDQHALELESPTSIHLNLKIYESLSQMRSLLTPLSWPSSNPDLQALLNLLDLVTLTYADRDFEKNYQKTLHHILPKDNSANNLKSSTNAKSLDSYCKQGEIISPGEFVTKASASLLHKAQSIISIFETSSNCYLNYLAGQAYRKEFYVERNIKKGISLINKASTGDVAPAYFTLISLDKTKDLPKKIFDDITNDPANASIAFGLGLLELEKNNKQEALKYLEIAGSTYNDFYAEALLYLALMSTDKHFITNSWKIISQELLTTRSIILLGAILNNDFIEHVKKYSSPNCLKTDFEEAYCDFQNAIWKENPEQSAKDGCTHFTKMIKQYSKTPEQKIALATCLHSLQEKCNKANLSVQFNIIKNIYDKIIPYPDQYGAFCPQQDIKTSNGFTGIVFK